jgi:hypothetical protein
MVRVIKIFLFVVTILITQQIIFLWIEAVMLCYFIRFKIEAIYVATNTNISKLQKFLTSKTTTSNLTWPIARGCTISTF